MNTNKKNIGLTNGWILCPSKSFPGKFYYFNVLNGETAWSLNDADKKGLQKSSSFHKIADKSHDYPEPTTLPDDTLIFSPNIGTNVKKPDFLKNIPCHTQLPTFGQAAFPKYVANVEPLMSNIVWTPVQLPMFCPESRRPMYDKVTQTSELERDLFIQTCDVPLCKRFKNYEQPSLSFDEKNKIVNKPVSHFKSSTPISSFFKNTPQSHNVIPKSKSLIKQPVLKLESEVPNPKVAELIKHNRKSTLRLANKVASPVTLEKVVPKLVNEEMLDDLDRTDLRFLLLAKRRKSVDATIETAIDRKKPKPSDVTLGKVTQKKVTFDLDSDIDEDAVMSDATTQEDFIPLVPSHIRNNIIDIPKTPVLHLKERTPPSPSINDTFVQSPKSLPTFLMKDIWYIVVDTDVLLLDYELIDKVVLSYNKCKLLIPYAVRADIEALCIGDCHGQQRIINARQLTRRLATPPQHYKVEPVPDDEDNIIVTADSILNCCVQAMNDKHRVVLITNDPCLKTAAVSLNIPSYKLNEIKNGVHIKPVMTEPKKIISNDDTDKNNPFIQNKTNLNLFNNINSLHPVDTVKKQLFSSKHEQTDKNISDGDKLINIKKPKCLKNNDITIKSDSESSTSDISREVQNLNLKDKIMLRSQNEYRNPFLPQNISNNKNKKEDYSINFEKIIQNSKAVFKEFNFEKTIPNTKRETFDFNSVSKSNHNFQKVALKENIPSSEKLFCSIPISNVKQTQFQNSSHFANLSNTKTMANSGVQVDAKIPNMCISLRHDPYGTSRESRVLNATQTRIRKMIRTINCDSTTNTQLENQEPTTKTNDATGLFKIPQPLHLKARTKKTSALNENPAATDNNRTRRLKNKDSIDENLKRFCVRSKNMSEKISTRIDEWICTYKQIMEDVLNSLLQKNSESMKNTVTPLTLHDTFNCIKMLYDSHTKIRDLVDKLSDLLNKCICNKGNLKPAIRPDDFMKMFGYGVLLVLSLECKILCAALHRGLVHHAGLLRVGGQHTIENFFVPSQEILPLSEELRDAESHLSSLLSTIESNTVELDPELLKTHIVSRSDVDGKDDEIRPNFLKEPAYVIEYLKKHYKEWASYTEDLDTNNHSNKVQNHSDFKVVRTFGKNLNMLKIDKSKSITLTKNTTEDDTVLKSRDKPKVIRLLENNKLNKPETNVNILTIDNKAAEPINIEHNIFLSDTLPQNDKKCFTFFTNDNIIITDEHKEVLKAMKPIANKVQDTESETKVIDELNYPIRNTQKGETPGPKMIRNIKIIDEYEKKIRSREPLDLDLLDYSEIYEPSVPENLQFDVLSANNIENNSEENIDNNNYTYGLTDTICTLQDFTADIKLGDNDFYASSTNNYEYKNDSCTFNNKKSVTGNDINIANVKKTLKNNDNYYFYSTPDSGSLNNDKITNNHAEKTNSELEYENVTSRNDSCFVNDNSETYTDNSGIQNDNCGTHIANSGTNNHNSGTHNDNYTINNDNYAKTPQIVIDDSTNDSGFENDSTYAHSLVKIFLNELSSTFKVIYEFVTKFLIEIREKELCEVRKNILHNQASKSLEDMVDIIQRLRSIVKRESAEETVLKTLLLKAGVEAISDKRMTRYRQVVIKSLEQAQILENALRIIVSTTIGDFDAISTNAISINSSIRYFNIFE